MRISDPVAWQEALQHVPGAEREVRVETLAGGTANATYRVQTRQGAFVVRLHEPFAADLGVQRQREAILHQSAAAAGLASRVLAADPAGRYLVTEFLGGPVWSVQDLSDPVRLRELAQVLARLHALPAPAVAPLDLDALLERHLAQLATQDPVTSAAWAPEVSHAHEILARRRAAGYRPSIVHGDLTHSNLIGAGRPRLIDWEYAAVGDPLADLACLCAYYPGALAYGPILLEECAMASSASLADLKALSAAYRLLSNLWYRRLELAGRHPPPAH